MAGINIREIGLDTLIEILEHGQFSHIFLRQVLDKYSYLEKSERAFLTRLVTGSIERKIELDAIVDSCSRTKVKKMKPLIRTIMRMGAYEIYYMDGVPASATCNEYVKLAKKRGFSGLSGFVNGVLRSIVRAKDSFVIDDGAIKYSLPTWLYDMWCKDYGIEITHEIGAGFFIEEKLCVRVNEAAISVLDFISLLDKAGIQWDKSQDLSTALYLSDFDSVTAIPGFNEGYFYVQDYSSQLVAHKAMIKPGDKILDVCAAPGGKALHAASIAGENGKVLARDLRPAKVAIIEENIARAGASNITAQVWDATVLDEESIASYDVVIADLPCSGLGIIRKKPDIKYNQTTESLASLVSLQAQILDVVQQYVAVGGILSYSTCTINKDENDRQVASFLDRHSSFEQVTCQQYYPDKYHDGFFISIMRKIR